MWKIKHIFDGDFGCEEGAFDEPMVSVTIANEVGEEKMETVADAWLVRNHLDVGSEWPDFSGVRIETKDLILKKAVYDDWKDIYENLWRHPESAKYMLWDVTTSDIDARARMVRTLNFQKYHQYALFIYARSTERAIGFAGMLEVEPGVYEDTGVALGPDFTGKGYGIQVLDALVREAAENGARKFIGTCRKQNVASHRLQMHCGFRFSHDENRVDPRDGSPYVLEFNELILR